ncbi:MAG: ribonuclease R [Acholeplasmataceae bacterium]
MNSPYIKFYTEKTQRLHRDELRSYDLESASYLVYDEPYYHLQADVLIGRLDHKRSFGFLRQEEDDVYIEGDDLGDAMHDDIVLVRDGSQPRVIRIVERALRVVIATVKSGKKGLYLQPDTYVDRPVEIESFERLAEGHVVHLDVLDIAASRIRVRLKEIIGHVNDPDIETLKIVSSYDWPKRFTEDVLSELEAIDTEQRSARLDLRDELTVTIDGADAKDLDDAISLKIENGNYHLGVHIADVSYYVRPDTRLDQAAYERATSVYLADRVIPMLPHYLSNNLCSLNPHEMKATLSCRMVIDSTGRVISHAIDRTLIKSDLRLNYGEVNEFLTSGKTLGHEGVEGMLVRMNELSNILKRVRRKRGEIEFESSELGFVVDDEGRVKDVYERTTGEAEELIESFMLIANETVASHLYHADLPALYRIHEKPDLDKIKQALLTIEKLGFTIPKKRLGAPKELQKLTRQSAVTPYGPIVHMLLLRAMQKAKYSDRRDIHYGLGARYYTHFTSPIRRYPDLMVHRLIHLLLLNESTDYSKDVSRYQHVLGAIAKHASDQERKAIQMERDVAKLKSCEYMSDRIGHRFMATITQMMTTGMFVRLESGIEGFVPLRDLKGYYRYDEARLAYVAHRGSSYRLGERVKVELASVDLMTRKMDFIIVSKNKGKKKKKRT